MRKLPWVLACSLLFSACTSTAHIVSPATNSPEPTVQKIIQPTSTMTTVAQPATIETPSLITKTTLAPTLDWWNEESKNSTEIGDQIVEAIERYYQDKGIYPNSLNDLVPVYIEEIPKTFTGRGFAYVLHSPDYFTLKFPFTRRSNDKVQFACGYSDGVTTIGEWECTHLLDYP